MPTVLRELGFRFFFYSNENNEPAHIHIEKGDATAKIWLQPIEIEHNFGFGNKEIKQILKIVTENQLNFIQYWHDYFNQN